jgi:hypothetical protein
MSKCKKHRLQVEPEVSPKKSLWFKYQTHNASVAPSRQSKKGLNTQGAFRALAGKPKRPHKHPEEESEEDSGSEQPRAKKAKSSNSKPKPSKDGELSFKTNGRTYKWLSQML